MQPVLPHVEELISSVFVTELSKESELLEHITGSYESACNGDADLYLTAQSIVNTARVYYKQEINLQVCD